ncbi:MAG: TIGR02757 family protein [Bacteroidales bacterium]|nr:TIGR02757 family protein [Bacteroidales bacterium]
MNNNELKTLLDESYQKYNTLNFIETDPIQIPHSFSTKENIEISAFLAATIAWGKRKMIIKNAKKMMEILDNNPFDFISNASEKDFNNIEPFVHRTFQHIDFVFFLKSMQNIYKNKGGLEEVFWNGYKKNQNIKNAIANFRKEFFAIPHPTRTKKHVADVDKNSAAKRINLFLMWLIRKDNIGVHFGLWDKFNPADLMLPLDVHTANMSRALELLSRKQNDWKAVAELTENLRKFDPNDPTKYDFAIFGLDINFKK